MIWKLIIYFQAFFKEKNVTAGARVINQSLEKCRLNCKWLERDGDKISGWLCSQK